MTERHNDRSVVAIWFIAFVALCALGLHGRCGADAQTDGSAPPMIVTWTGGSLPSLSGDGAEGGDGGRGRDVVQVSSIADWQRVHTGTTVAGAPPEFRHLAHVEGTAPGCIFTATPLHAIDGTLLHSAGGRDCPLAENDRRCGYIATGFLVFARAGASCEEFGIPDCTGPFCY